MKIFGVSVDGEGKEAILARIQASKAALWIVTANPEILLAARQDSSYKQILHQADLRSVDGVGLEWIGRLFGQSWTRVTGVELGESLLSWAHERDLRVALIGGRSKIAELAAAHWRALYPGLALIAERGGVVQADGMDDEMGEEARHRLTLFAPQIVLVAFGHPKQERWIARHMADMPGLKVIMGVGGAFDYWAGEAKRAPRVMRRWGLEWLWRVIHEPKRILRIVRAVIIFPVLAFVDRFRA